MKIDETTFIDLFDGHCKGKYPREFGTKLRNGKFMRNNEIVDPEHLYNLCKIWDFEDCFCSVYAFKEWHNQSKIRKQKAIIDCLAFDLDHKENLNIAFKEAKKLVRYLLSKNTIPRVYFSGAKGFHVYIDFPSVELENVEAVKRVGIRIAERLKLKTVDSKVFEVSRVIRLPLTTHSKTKYRCTPIDPYKFLKLDLNSILYFCKYSYSNIEINECESFVKLLKYEDFRISTNKVVREIIKPKFKAKFKSKNNGNTWKERRIEEYIEALKKYGRLTADPKINERHKGNEHHANLHLNCLMIECGHSDEEIREVFKLREDWKPDMSEYQIKYNRKWLRNKMEAGACKP